MATQTQKTRKIAILSVSAGAGHVRAAQALQAAAEKWYPGVETVHIDLMELVPKLFKTVYADTYLKVVERHPAFWGYLYDRTDRERVDSALSRLRIAIERLNTRKLKQVGPGSTRITSSVPTSCRPSCCRARSATAASPRRSGCR